MDGWNYEKNFPSVILKNVAADDLVLLSRQKFTNNDNFSELEWLVNVTIIALLALT